MSYPHVGFYQTNEYVSWHKSTASSGNFYSSNIKLNLKDSALCKQMYYSIEKHKTTRCSLNLFFLWNSRHSQKYWWTFVNGGEKFCDRVSKWWMFPFLTLSITAPSFLPLGYLLIFLWLVLTPMEISLKGPNCPYQPRQALLFSAGCSTHCKIWSPNNYCKF